MVERKFRHMLLSRYKKLANEQKLDTNINSHVEQWAADSLIESYTLDICYEMLDYYFRVSDSPLIRCIKIYRPKKKMIE